MFGFALLISGLLIFASSSPASGQSSINGHVVLIETGDPLTEAVIKLKSRQGFEVAQFPSALTDSSGYFEFNSVPENVYMLEMSTMFNIEGQQVRCAHTISQFELAEQPAYAKLGISLYHCYWLASLQPWFEGRRMNKDAEPERSFAYLSGNKRSIMASGTYKVSE